MFAMISSMLFPFILKKHYIKHLLFRRRELFKDQFIQLLQSLSASMACGRQMGEALEEGLDNLKKSYNQDTPLVLELEHVVKSINNSREKEEVLLRGIAIRSKLEEMKIFVDVFTICRETGGDMEKAISRTIRILLDKMSIEREMMVMMAQKKLESKIISFMPFGVILFLKLTSSDYIEPLYATISGRIIMTLSLGVIWLSYRMTSQITKLNI
jgi:tight adherence protein B